MEQTQVPQWEAVEPNVWKFEKEGDSIEGTLVLKKTNIGVNHSNAYYIQKADGSQWLVWGSKIMDDRMELVPEMSQVKIVFKNRTLNAKKQPLKIFQVFTQKAI